ARIDLGKSDMETEPVEKVYLDYKPLKNQARKVVCIPAPAATGGGPVGRLFLLISGLGGSMSRSLSKALPTQESNRGHLASSK
ncbi:hypothetical protein E2562_025458, partial [Oryza meyeriana var. granulata]